jgi:hypothetical protein
MSPKPLAILALAALLAGCGGSSAVLLSAPRPSISPAEVRIYRNMPEGAIEIAQLQSSSGMGFGGQGQSDAVVERLKREAAAVGANGVVLFGFGSSPSNGAVSVGGSTWGSNSGGGVAIGVPTSQQRASGLAIYVPEALPPEP